MESIRAASAAVKYSVVNQEKEVGLFRAMPVKRTVHTGKRLVATPATFTYPSKIFFPKPSSLFSGSTGSAASLDMRKAPVDTALRAVGTGRAANVLVDTRVGREDGAKADPRQGRAAIATMEAIFMMLVVKM
jgi:hypothetical protein